MRAVHVAETDKIARAEAEGPHLRSDRLGVEPLTTGIQGPGIQLLHDYRTQICVWNARKEKLKGLSRRTTPYGFDIDIDVEDNPSTL
jgi:hypothetical protein